MIFFIDDEPERVENYLDALEIEFPEREVKRVVGIGPDDINGQVLQSTDIAYFDAINVARAATEIHGEHIELLILDIMMPTKGTYSDDETAEGLRTGIVFYEELRKRYKEMPVIVLTNVHKREVVGYFKNQPNCDLYHKESLGPRELTEHVKSILEKVKK